MGSSSFYGQDRTKIMGKQIISYVYYHDKQNTKVYSTVAANFDEIE